MDVAVVWTTQDPAATPAESRRALDEWARARGFKLVEPAADASNAISIDHDLADKAEQDLDRARDAIAGQDADAADKALKRAEAAVREHPEIPQAAWIMAEVRRTWAARWSRLEPRDPEKAARAWREAAALDGGRVAGLGETNVPGGGLAIVSATLDAEGSDGLELRVDGVATRAGKVRAAAGEHHVAVLRDGATLWAGWMTWSDGAVLHAPVPSPVECSETELRRAKIEDEQVRVSNVRCTRWAIASPTERPDVIRVAVCDYASCGPLLEWRAHAFGETPHPEAPHASRGGFPAWGWALAGVGAIALTGVVLVSAGAFDKPQPAEIRFVNGGVRVETR